MAKAAKKEPAGVPQVARFTVNLGALPHPQVTVYTNRCAVIDWEFCYEFAFYQVRPSEQPFHVASLAVGLDALISNFWTPAIDFYKNERAFFERAGWPITEVIKPPKPLGETPIVPVNVFRMARAGVDAAMDCFYVSPASLHAAGTQAQPLEFQPIVRLHLPAPVLLGVLEFVASGLKGLQGRLGSLLQRPNAGVQ